MQASSYPCIPDNAWIHLGNAGKKKGSNNQSANQTLGLNCWQQCIAIIQNNMRLIICICLLFGFYAGTAQNVVNSREDAVRIIGDLRKIHTPDGIEILEQVTLNGAPQWISIRGKNKANPVLLFIHGGPASPMMPVSWAFQTGWEDYFTVVQWDQRVSGKNWMGTDTTAAAASLTAETIVEDGLALVRYLREKLHKEKVFVLGYSFGARIGIQMAALIPEQLHAYVGVGQVSPGNAEAYLYQKLLALAAAGKNDSALQELRSIAPHPRPDGSTPVRNLLIARKWARYYNGGWYGKQDLDLFFQLPSLAPEYSKEDILSMDISTSWTSRKIMRQATRKEPVYNFKVPIVFIMGEHDLQTPYEPARKYFEQITAPAKQFHSFSSSAHFPMLEEPGRFLVTLVNDILPLAK